MKCLECDNEAATNGKLCLNCQEWVDEPVLPNDRLYQAGLELSQSLNKPLTLGQRIKRIFNLNDPWPYPDTAHYYKLDKLAAITITVLGGLFVALVAYMIVASIITMNTGAF